MLIFVFWYWYVMPWFVYYNDVMCVIMLFCVIIILSVCSNIVLWLLYCIVMLQGYDIIVFVLSYVVSCYIVVLCVMILFCV